MCRVTRAPRAWNSIPTCSLLTHLASRHIFGVMQRKPDCELDPDSLFLGDPRHIVDPPLCLRFRSNHYALWPPGTQKSWVTEARDSEEAVDPRALRVAGLPPPRCHCSSSVSPVVPCKLLLPLLGERFLACILSPVWTGLQYVRKSF